MQDLQRSTRDETRAHDASVLREETEKHTSPEIMFVLPALLIGGTELHVVKIAAALVHRGWRVSIFSMGGSGPLLSELAGSGVTVLMPAIEPLRRRLFLAWRPLALILASFDLFLAFLKRRPKVVHFFLPSAYLVGAPVAWLARVPIRIVSRRSLNLYQRGYRSSAALERVLHKTMTAILGNSRTVICELNEHEGVAVERLGLIYNGVDAGEFECTKPREDVRAALGLSPQTIIFIIVANLIPYKGHLDLLQALGLAKARLPNDWRLLVAGQDLGIGAQLQATAKSLQIDRNVIFLGLRRDIPDLLKASDIGLLSSHEEGFSNALLEGMAAGLPMIVTDAGGNGEAVTDGETGLIVPSRDPLRMAEAMIALAGDPSMRERLGAAARRRIAERFTFDHCADSYDALYRVLIAGGAVSDVEGVRA
jgi:glycosyltransferase involved in cell wall biosynthesis